MDIWAQPTSAPCKVLLVRLVHKAHKAIQGRSVLQAPKVQLVQSVHKAVLAHKVQQGHKVLPVLKVQLVLQAQLVHKAVPGHKVQQEQWGRQARKDRKV